MDKLALFKEATAAGFQELTKECDRLRAQVAEQRKRLEALQIEQSAAKQKYDDNLEMVMAQMAIVDALVGNDITSKEVVRGIVLLLMAHPGWALSAEGVQKITHSIGPVIQAAVVKGVQQ